MDRFKCPIEFLLRRHTSNADTDGAVARPSIETNRAQNVARLGNARRARRSTRDGDVGLQAQNQSLCVAVGKGDVYRSGMALNGASIDDRPRKRLTNSLLERGSARPPCIDLSGRW